jgi:hypothetical protein
MREKISSKHAKLTLSTFVDVIGGYKILLANTLPVEAHRAIEAALLSVLAWVTKLEFASR